MTDFLKIGRFELRRQRLNLCIAFPMIFVLAALAFGGIFPHTWKDDLAGYFMLIVPLGGLFLSLDVFTRDFHQGTSPIFFTLPVKPWKIYLAKYLFSASLFLVILLISVALTAFFTSIGTLPWILGRIDRPHDTHSAVIAAFYSITSFAVILLYLHASVMMWCIAFKGSSGIAASFFLIPVVFFLLLPSFIWFSRDYPVTLYGCIPQILVYVLILVFIGGLFWRRGIGMGRPMWILALKSLGILFTASVLSFAIFYSVQITKYMVTLAEFEKTPGIDIPVGKIAVVRAIWEGKVPKSADDVLNADLKTTIEISVGDYGKYADRLQRFFLDSNLFITREVSLKHYDRALRLLDAYESIPESIIPQVTWFTFFQERGKFDENGRWKRKYRKEIFVQADHFIPGSFYQGKYRLKGKSNDEKKDMPYLILPFEKDTLPFLDRMIERMKNQSVWRERPIKVLPLGTEVISTFSQKTWERYYFEQGLRTFLPGIEKHGFSRFLDVALFVFRMVPEWRFALNYPRGGDLRPSIRSMKAWIWSVGKRAEIAKSAASGEILSCLNWSQDTGAFYYNDVRLREDWYNDVSKKYFWLPRLKLRKYALEHGTLPEKLSDALSEDEIIHKVNGRLFRLEYSVHPKYKKSYPRGSVISGDYKETRRHPRLHLVERKLPFYDFIYECELDEPEEPLPEKGVLK
ncbi:MAG: ABC-2 family transporter protein [Lentisphaerae bacterium ADurb.Bin242]|nr:MAG: ABC-2 family transporter protein [Lentisphaerae bacterium ADurb.Bin242]